MNLNLSEDEARLLGEVLRDYLGELRREIARTDARDYRHTLVLRQELCERLVDQLRLREMVPAS